MLLECERLGTDPAKAAIEEEVPALNGARTGNLTQIQLPGTHFPEGQVPSASCMLVPLRKFVNTDFWALSPHTVTWSGGEPRHQNILKVLQIILKGTDATFK